MRCQVHLPEGPARRVRSRTFDHLFAFTGHDKRAPPTFAKSFSAGPASEGPACQVRCSTFNNPFPFTGHDKRAPPKNSGGTCLSRPFPLEGTCSSGPCSVGRACHVRFSTLDNPLPFAGD